MSSIHHGTPGPVLLYDGTCGFCARSVQFVLRHERSRVLRFAPLDSAVGRKARAALPGLEAADSMILLDGAAPRVRSDAALGVASIMGGPWRMAAVARVVPRRLRDAVYNFVARHRHRLSGAPSCVVPPEGEAHRFIAAGTILLMLAAGCSPGADRPSAADSLPPSAETVDSLTWVARADGIGPIRAGMTLDEAAAALGEPIHVDYADFGNCDYATPAALPDGVSLMIIADTVERVDVIDPSAVRTAAGAGIGDLESSVVASYGSAATVEPHKYTGPEGHYVVVAPPGDSVHRIIFETDGDTVTMYRVGRMPAVRYVEGCA